MDTLAKHIVSGYDADLNELTTSLSELGSVVEGMVADSVRAMKKRDEHLAQGVVERDKEANRLQAKIDQDAMHILALRKPLATDLRRTIGAIRVASDLERIGDLADGIAQRAMEIADLEARISVTKAVTRMGKQVKANLSAALDAFLRDDASGAVQVWMGDRDIDETYNSILRELLTYMMGDPRMINGCTALLFAAKNLERIGDHASNICEVLYFTIHGRPLIEDEEIQALLARNG